MYPHQYLILVVVSLQILTWASPLPQSDEMVFEGEERRAHRRRRKRPCRGRTPDGRIFVYLNYVNVNNNNYDNCGNGGAAGYPQKPSNVGAQHFPGVGQVLSGAGHFQGNQPPLGGGHFQPNRPGGGGNNYQTANVAHQSNSDQNGDNGNIHVDHDPVDFYNRPTGQVNPIVGVAEGVQNTILGVTNAVTGTVQQIVRPGLVNNLPEIDVNNRPNPSNNAGLFFGLFDGSLITDFISNVNNRGSTTTTTPSPNKPVTEIYDEVEPDPILTYRPTQQVIGNNPLTGQYSVGNFNSKQLFKQLNRGIDTWINPFLELLY